MTRCGMCWREDILDLISPFILYAVGVTTKKGDAIDVDKVCACMVEEFGYRSFQPIIVNKILIRLIGKSRAENKTVIEKRSETRFVKGVFYKNIQNCSWAGENSCPCISYDQLHCIIQFFRATPFSSPRKSRITSVTVSLCSL